jgi:hypothetical protein
MALIFKSELEPKALIDPQLRQAPELLIKLRIKSSHSKPELRIKLRIKSSYSKPELGIELIIKSVTEYYRVLLQSVVIGVGMFA